MPNYNAPQRDIEFVLHEVLNISTNDIPNYDELTCELTSQVINEAAKIATNVLAPLNQIGDQQGVRFKDGNVYVPDGFQAAFDQLRQGGWTLLDLAPEYGGQGMPSLLYMVVQEIFASANLSITSYPGLTHGAWSTIFAHGTPEQKQTYLPKMTSCEWTGTMNLTEPHCGTDLGLMRTKAVPQSDGSYKISGTKIFITAGDHDMSENIIHLVLAKIPDGPDGIKGVSLFIVPKFLVNDDNSIGARNAVTTGNVEHKMGIHASATCVLNYDEAIGYLLGDTHKGMRAMFTMMNEARIATGAQGYALAEVAYQNAVAYAHDRLQGRCVVGIKNPDGPADPLIVHPDIRRTLMDQRSFIEGARVFTYWCSMLADRAKYCNDNDAHGLLSLLTPVLKAFLTDKGFEAVTNAQQVFGGHGYIEEWGMSQFVRDARIAKIYEGANGVQALDLVARKLGADQGRHTFAYAELIKDTAQRLAHNDDLADWVAKPLLSALDDFQAAAQYMMEHGGADPEAALCGSTDFLHLMGYLTFGYVHALSAEAAQKALENNKEKSEFYSQKLLTARHYLMRHLPMTQIHLKCIQAGSQTIMTPDAAVF